MSWSDDIEAWKSKQGVGNVTTRKDGYADRPGSGPSGETCKTCRYYERVVRAKAYLKCALMRAVRTGGPGTDIKAGSPACSKWQKPE